MKKQESKSDKLQPIFKQFLLLLNKHQIQYLIIGGYAVAVHGYVRATGDIDIWVNPTEENANQLLLVMLEFGFDVYDFQKEDFLISEKNEGGFVSFGEVPFKIEILTTISGVTFQEAYQNKTIIIIDEITLNFIGLKELIQNKKATGQGKGLLDIENLPKPDEQ